MCVPRGVCLCISGMEGWEWGGCNPFLREPMKETAEAKRLRPAFQTHTHTLTHTSLPPPQPPPACYLLHPGCQVVAAQQNKVNRGQTRAFSPSPLMRECCLVPRSMCECLRAPAHPSFTMPVLKLLSDPASVRTQVSLHRCRCHRRRCCVCPRWCVCVSAVLFKALLHFEEGSPLQLFPKETPIDLTLAAADLKQETRMFFFPLPP